MRLKGLPAENDGLQYIKRQRRRRIVHEELKKVNAERSTAGVTPLSEEEFENILDQEEDYVVQERIGILEWFYDRFIGNGYNEDDNDEMVTCNDHEDKEDEGGGRGAKFCPRIRKVVIEGMTCQLPSSHALYYNLP